MSESKGIGIIYKERADYCKVYLDFKLMSMVHYGSKSYLIEITYAHP